MDRSSIWEMSNSGGPARDSVLVAPYLVGVNWGPQSRRP